MSGSIQLRGGILKKTAAFTLIELLVVIGIIALLLGLITPALQMAMRSSRKGVCAARVRACSNGFFTYSAMHNGRVIPSYTMTGTLGGASVPLEGWTCLLDLDGLVTNSEEMQTNSYFCPETVTVAGVAENGNTGTDPNNSKGYMDWPALRMGSRMDSTTIPSRGINVIRHVSYWMNADNPIGTTRANQQGVFFSCSVGYGPDSNGRIEGYNSSSTFARPSQLIAIADGLYAGQQSAVRKGDKNLRIGYRHGAGDTANVGFADGHGEPLTSDQFPRSTSYGVDNAKKDNLGVGPTIYADPQKFLGP